MFPFAFCFTRLIEDRKVANCLLLIWDKIKAIMKFWQSLAKSKCLQCQSYLTAVEGTAVAKLHFFNYLAGLLQSMLLKYQTNWPLIPFFCQDFFSLVKDVMRLCEIWNFKHYFNQKGTLKIWFYKERKLAPNRFSNCWFCCRVHFKRSQKERCAPNRCVKEIY